METATETTYTAGPWEISDYYRAGENREIMGPDGYPVAEVSDTAIRPGYAEEYDVDHWSGHEGTAYIERPQEEWEANARLIAAAPDLLASLLELVTSPNAKQNEMWDRARAAVSKAI